MGHIIYSLEQQPAGWQLVPRAPERWNRPRQPICDRYRNLKAALKEDKIDTTSLNIHAADLDICYWLAT